MEGRALFNKINTEEVFMRLLLKTIPTLIYKMLWSIAGRRIQQDIYKKTKGDINITLLNVGDNHCYVSGDLLKHKNCLAMLYGCSVGNPRKQNGLYNILKLANNELPLHEVKEIYNSYWNALPDVARFRDNVTAFAEKCKKENKPFFNYGGFILPSKQPHKAFNYSIQSFLSSWVRKLLHTMEKEGVFNKDCRLVCVVHDEIVVEVTKGKEEDYRTKVFKAMDDTNEFFNLKYPLQLGFNVGENFYDIH